MTLDDPLQVMTNFDEWIQSNSKGRPVFISDNNGFDWMFVCWYYLRKTEHTHNPVDDTKGNAGVLLHLKKEMGLKIVLK